MRHDDHRRQEEATLTHSEIYRQLVVTLRKSGGFVSQRDLLYEALETADIQYAPVAPVGEIAELWMVAIQLAESEDVAHVVAYLSTREMVEVVEQNRALRANATVDDPLFWDQWALHKISAEAAWAKAVGAQAVVVAIIDTGICPPHPDLAAHLWTNAFGHHGFNVLTNTHHVADADGHGTLLAGTIGAVSNNTLGIAAAEWPIQLMAVKFHDVRTPPTAWNATVGIAWAVLQGARVINASWDVGLPLVFLRFAIEFAGLAGTIVVAAAGNDGLDNDVLPTYPASYALPNVVSVMASDEGDDKPGFSNYGRTTVHLAAPGVRILSTHSYFVTPAWRYYSGTSAACAHVTNAAALLRAVRPAWTPHQVRQRLINTVDKSPWLSCLAEGRLNLERAIP
ncbi:MAG: S8 family peptidase [Candidatus Rokuibacteriota bacterium]